jgi:hypothetical protein
LLQAQFAKASALVGNEFLARLDYYGKAWLPARNLVAEALQARFVVEPSGQIILFETYLPWKVGGLMRTGFSVAHAVSHAGAPV